MEVKTKENEIFIDIVTDGSKRKYNSFYNTKTNEYILKYEFEGKEEESRKKSSDIEYELFDPFTAAKMIHEN
jgi:hypothetical protein